MILKYYYNCKEFVPFHKGKTNISLHISKTIKIPKFIFVFAYKLPFHEIEFILHTLTCFLRNNLINVILNEVFVKTLALKKHNNMDLLNLKMYNLLLAPEKPDWCFIDRNIFDVRR